MKIAAVDYGLHVGLAIAELCQDTVLKKVHLGTHYEGDAEVAQRIITEECKFVAMEEPPYAALGGSAASFYRILGDLQQSGYVNNYLAKTFLLEHGIATYLPGVWKPFVDSLKPDLSAWQPQTNHEKDAMGIMWYALKTLLKKEIKYE